MRLGIMQPYFFPYAQQFRHIGQCDAWIVFDTVKFTRKSWISRNRIANRDRGWSYISAPVARGASRGPIRAAALDGTGWHADLEAQLQVYRGAPFFAETLALVRDGLAPEGPAETVATLNSRILTRVAAALGLDTPIRRLSTLGLVLPERAAPGEWALLIAQALGAKVYSNAPGGVALFDPDLYAHAGVALEFYQPKPLSYLTPGFEPVPDLSVIDPLMWLGAEALGRWCRDEAPWEGAPRQGTPVR